MSRREIMLAEMSDLPVREGGGQRRLGSCPLKVFSAAKKCFLMAVRESHR